MDITFDTVRTGSFSMDYCRFGHGEKALVILPEREESIIRATANLPQAKVSYVNTLNVYDILNADKLVMTVAAKESVEEVYA